LILASVPHIVTPMLIQDRIRRWALAWAMMAVAALLALGAAPFSHAEAVELGIAPAMPAHGCCHDPVPIHQQLPCPHFLAQIGGPLPAVLAIPRALGLSITWPSIDAALLGLTPGPLTPPPKRILA
jgi:hypothetical protein